MSILIIDDSALHLRLIEDILQSAGFIDTIAIDSADGASACVSGKVGHSEDQTLDLILMDIMMPDVNGFEACRLIKAQPHMADVPVIMITAMTDEDSLRRAFAAVATDYIRKPIVGGRIGRTRLDGSDDERPQNQTKTPRARTRVCDA